jgi:hypothetical protein
MERKMKRRRFLRMVLFGWLSLFLARHAHASLKDDRTLRKAMFWRKSGKDITS